MSNLSFDYTHAPGATLDYGLDWSQWLTSPETITTSTWTVDTGLMQSNPSNIAGVTSVFLAGGTAGAMYKVVNTITTSVGRIDSRIIRISCNAR